MVLIAVNLPVRAQNVKFQVCNDGYSFTVKYYWSKTWYKMDESVITIKLPINVQTEATMELPETMGCRL